MRGAPAKHFTLRGGSGGFYSPPPAGRYFTLPTAVKALSISSMVSNGVVRRLTVPLLVAATEIAAAATLSGASTSRMTSLSPKEK